MDHWGSSPTKTDKTRLKAFKTFYLQNLDVHNHVKKRQSVSRIKKNLITPFCTTASVVSKPSPIHLFKPPSNTETFSCPKSCEGKIKMT